MECLSSIPEFPELYSMNPSNHNFPSVIFKRRRIKVCLQVFCVLLMQLTVANQTSFAQQARVAPRFVPTPQDLVIGRGTVQLDQDSRIFFESRNNVGRQIELSLEPLADVLAEEIEILTGFRLEVAAKSTDNVPGPRDIDLGFTEVVGEFAESEAEEDQSYTCAVDGQGIKIRSQYTKGVAYGTVSLLQALVVGDDECTIPELDISDRPHDAFRNIMIDVARNPISVGVIKDVIRLARLYKIRYVQLHLTDDQSFTFPFPPIIDGLKKNGHANYSYTRGQLEELVAYADARGVTLIPELELPGHSTKISQSGYLSPLDKNHAQIADPANFEKLVPVIDDILSVFKSSPYFHMGGDESGAGRKLVPLVAAVNQHLRGNPVGGKRRLIVWEGFHGAPTGQIPPTGEDRVIVMAWESSYNAPWDLLNNGYEIINASWKPTYIVGGFGGLIHAGSGGCKNFALEDLYAWDKSTFMHWEPRRPVYEDAGPRDPTPGDHLWNAEWIDKQDQITGGMLLYWEQREGSTVHYLLPRVPVLAQRLWNPNADLDYEQFAEKSAMVQAKVLPIIQPVQILPATDSSAPVSILFRHYTGDSIKVELKNRTRIPGTLRFATGKSSSWMSNPNFGPVPPPDTVYHQPVLREGEFSIRAELVRSDETIVGGHSWAFFANWPMKVQVREFDIGGVTLPEVPDLAELPEDRLIRQYQMPYVRGLLNNQRLVGQMSTCDFVPPQDGEFVFELKTQSGHATLYIDLNQNGSWDEGEALIRNTPNTEVGKTATASFESGQRYRLRLDHSTGLPRPVLSLSVTTPAGKRTTIDALIELPK